MSTKKHSKAEKDRVDEVEESMEEFDVNGPETESEVEKKRRLWRVRKRKQRAEEKEQKLAETTHAETEWWQRNRAQLPPKELEAMLAHDALCYDHVIVMDYAIRNNISLDDLNYVFEKDCVAELVDFVKRNSCPHLGAIFYHEELHPDWCSRKYWQDEKLLRLLYDEGEATERMVKYGLLSGVPDCRVQEFLIKIAKWPWDKVAALLGYKTDRNGSERYQ